MAKCGVRCCHCTSGGLCVGSSDERYYGGWYGVFVVVAKVRLLLLEWVLLIRLFKAVNCANVTELNHVAHKPFMYIAIGS